MFFLVQEKPPASQKIVPQNGLSSYFLSYNGLHEDLFLINIVLHFITLQTLPDDIVTMTLIRL